MEKQFLNDSLKSLGLESRISPNIYLSDFLKLETFSDFTYENACIYVSQLIQSTNLKLATTLTELDSAHIIILPNWLTILKFNSVIVISSQHLPNKELRENTKNSLKQGLKNSKIQEYTIKEKEKNSYILLGIIKIWIEYKEICFGLIEKFNFQVIANEIKIEIEENLLKRAKMSVEKILENKAKARKAIFNQECEIFKWTVVEKPWIMIQKQEKPADAPRFPEKSKEIPQNSGDSPTKSVKFVEISDFSFSKNEFTSDIHKKFLKSGKIHLNSLESPESSQKVLEKSESFSLSSSESTEKMDELSFRASEIFQQRFPRISAASITVVDTPSKEFKKSFVDYTEVIESPRYNIKFESPQRKNIITPIDSPRQALFSISEVKNFMTSDNSLDEYFLRFSPTEKIEREKEKKNKKYLKVCEFDEDLKNSLKTEVTNSSEIGKNRMHCDGKNQSCHCSTCLVF